MLRKGLIGGMLPGRAPITSTCCRLVLGTATEITRVVHVCKGCPLSIQRRVSSHGSTLSVDGWEGWAIVSTSRGLSTLSSGGQRLVLLVVDSLLVTGQ